MTSKPKYPFLRYSWFFIILAIAGAYTTTQAASERSLRGIPYYRFFTSSDFDSGASSVFITTAADGSIFYGDRNWIFRYDGTTWHKVYQNSNTSQKITALLWDTDGKTYAGSYNNFGEFIIDENNIPRFQTLVPDGSVKLGESIEKLESTKEAVYISGRRSFAYYDKKQKTIDAHVLSTWLTATFFMDGKYHLLTDNNDILRYEDGKLLRLDAVSKILSESKITVADIVIDRDGTAIMASERRGLFRFDGKTLQRAYPNFRHNPDHLITDIETISNDRLILASLGGGITILDTSGAIIEELGPATDFRFKSARAINVDQSGTVWAMFNSTIAKVLIDSPLTAIDEHLRPSFFYASQLQHKGDLYVRSFYILYKAVFSQNGRISHFENAIPDSDIEVWAMTNTAEDIYVNTANDGIFRLKGDTLEFQIQSQAYDRLEHSKSHPQYLLGANASNIALYELLDGKLKQVEQIENPEGFVNRLIEDATGDFWLEYGLGRVGKLNIQNGRLDLTVYNSEHGIPKNDWAALWMHEGKAHLVAGGKVYSQNQQTKAFERAFPLEATIGKEENRIGRSFTDATGNLWVSASDKNLIFWKQADGSYLFDEVSLSEMGEPYFESIEFLENGDALIMTSFELFHFKKKEESTPLQSNETTTQIIEISDAKNDTIHFISLGNDTTPNFREFDSNQNNIAFTVSNAFSQTTLAPQFQFVLEGFSDNSASHIDSPWLSSSSVSYTNLDFGEYTFNARTKLGNGFISPWVSYSFKVAPPLHKTIYAYSFYAFVLIVLILVSLNLNSRRLRKQNLKLETTVKSRTKEVQTKNEELERQARMLESNNLELEERSAELRKNTTELASALIELNDTQDKLLTTARIAGRAEVATNVLHNVGNVLNSVNIGLNNLDKKVANSRAKSLSKIVSLIKENETELARFFQEDERGKKIPAYLDQLAEALINELHSYSKEIQEIDKNVDHIKRIIATQQTHAKKIGVEQDVHLAELLESALAITLGESFEATYPTTKDYDWDLSISTDKHLVLDVAINLIKNAKESLAHLSPAERTLAVSCHAKGEDRIVISITDNGLGIDTDDKAKLFTHGFTTKPDGHGFGLHVSANSIKSIGGSLKLESNGLNKGATATIELPR